MNLSFLACMATHVRAWSNYPELAKPFPGPLYFDKHDFPEIGCCSNTLITAPPLGIARMNYCHECLVASTEKTCWYCGKELSHDKPDIWVGMRQIHETVTGFVNISHDQLDNDFYLTLP